MARKATNRVTTIGIDIGKSSFYFIGFEVRFGSKAAVIAYRRLRPLLRNSGRRTHYAYEI